MSIVEDTRVITGGVDTHAGMHVAAALDPLGGLLGGREVPAAAARYAGLLSWLGGFGDLALAGVEGTGSYGAGLTRYLAAAGIRVVEVDRADPACTPTSRPPAAAPQLTGQGCEPVVVAPPL